MPVSYTEGLKTGTPLSSNTLLAEFVNPGGDGLTYSPQIFLSASGVCNATLQRRNAANNATIWEHAFIFTVTTPPINFNVPLVLDTGERFRIILSAVLIGSVQASMFGLP